MTKLEEFQKKSVAAINQHDPNAVAAFYAADAVVYDPTYPAPLRGREAITRDAEVFFRAFPDLKVELVSEAEKGDQGAAEFRMTGTHRGPLETPQGSIPPTNKRIDLKGVSWTRLNSQGLVIEERRYYDTATFMQQLGVTPKVLAGVR